MKGPARSWRRPGLVIGGAAAGMIAVGLCTTPAAAHTPNWSVTCSEVTVDLTAYNSGVTNTVSIQVGDKDLLAAKTFGKEYHDKIALPEHTSPLSVHLVVKAGDGERFSRDETKVAPVCEAAPETTPTPAEPPKEEPAEPPAEKPAEESAAPVTDNKPAPTDLAETGSSSNTPIIAGAAAVVVVAGGGILLATRKRSAARH